MIPADPDPDPDPDPDFDAEQRFKMFQTLNLMTLTPMLRKRVSKRMGNWP
jgi:hypothetical protein